MEAGSCLLHRAGLRRLSCQVSVRLPHLRSGGGGKTATVFHAGTKLGEDGSILTAGGRVLGVTALGATLEEAIANAYAAAKPISFQDMHMRTDIGKV